MPKNVSFDLNQLPLGRHPKSSTGLLHGFIKGERGSYDVFDVIGTGATSKVKLIKDRSTGKKRALKIIYSHGLFNDKKARRAYDNEFHILNKLGKVDPVKIETISHKTGVHKYQIVMDLAEGQELWSLIHEKPELLPASTAKLLKIGLDILVDLFTIHQQGILLIDDKAENIFVGEDPNNPGTYKVTRIDFGFAEQDYDFVHDPGLTTVFRGTPEVSGPEVLEKAGPDYKGKVTFCKATEVFTVGVTLAELLELRSDIIYRSYPEIRSLLLQMISENPKNRPSLEYAIEVFEQALHLKKGSSVAEVLAKTQSAKTKSSDLSEPPKPALKAGAFEQAYKEYEAYKNKFFGIRWLFANEATLKTIKELEVSTDENMRYQKAKDFISKNPSSLFAKKLAYASQDTELNAMIRNASSY